MSQPMKASGEKIRRRRYERAPERAPAAISPLGLTLLTILQQFRLLSLPQLACVSALSLQGARRQMRRLLDAGFVRIVALPRVALMEATKDTSPQYAFGSAPNIFQATRQGLTLLLDLGRISSVAVPAPYGPHNWAFVRHELGCRDCILWFLRCAREYPSHELALWRLGGEAEIDLKRSEAPTVARPDGLLVYRMGERVLMAALEFDRGTEKGIGSGARARSSRWEQKANAYRLVLTGDYLKETLGYQYGRVLVVTISEQRRDQLAEFIAQHTEARLHERFWIAVVTVLDVPDLSQKVWRKPGLTDLCPLVPPEMLAGD